MTVPVSVPSAAEPEGRIWPRWATAADFSGARGEALRQEMSLRLELPPYAESVAVLMGRDTAGHQFTKIMAWPFARHLLDRPTDWWHIADKEPAQPGWPRRSADLLGTWDLAGLFPLFAILPDRPAAVAFRGDDAAWQRARRHALSDAVARQDGPDRWSIRVPEPLTPWLTAHWSIPYPARNVPVSRNLAALTIGQPSGGVLRGRKTATVELDEVQTHIAALAHILVGVARDTSRAAAGGAVELRSLLWRVAQEQSIEEGDITLAHRQAYKWLAGADALQQAS